MMIPLINPHPTFTPEQMQFRVSQAKLVRYYRQVLRKGKLKIKKPNPARPPKEWFYRKVAQLARSGRYKEPARMAAHLWYHVASKKRKKEILSEERPALSRGFNNPHKESDMVYSLVKRSRRRAKAKARRRRNNPKFGLHRPTLLYSGGKWFRRKRSKLMKKGTRVNPKRRYARSRKSYRRNPALPFDIKNVAMGGVKIAGGIVAGGLLMPVVCMVMPKTATEKYGKYFGAIHVVLGAVLATFLKNKMLKDAALVVAGTGVYDLIASNVAALGLPQLPRTSTLIKFKGEEPGVIGSSYQEQVGIDYAPALSASYQEVGDDIAYGGDEIEIG